MRRKETKERRKGKHVLTAMKRVGQDRTEMTHSERWPRVHFRIGDELLGQIAKEIEKTGMNTSEIAKKALSEYFAKRE